MSDRSNQILRRRKHPPPHLHHLRDGRQQSLPVDETTTTPDSHWGPFTLLPKPEYEFDLEGQDHTPSATPRHVRFFFAGLPIRDTFIVQAPRAHEMVEITLRHETIKVSTSSDLATDMPIAYFLW